MQDKEDGRVGGDCTDSCRCTFVPRVNAVRMRWYESGESDERWGSTLTAMSTLYEDEKITLYDAVAPRFN